MRWTAPSAVALAVTILPLHAAHGVKVNRADGLKYVWIEPGHFVMGCAGGPEECFSWELAPRLVEIPAGFWMGETEVTQRAYQRVTGKNPSMYRGPQLPVDQIGWDDAKKYCEQVGMKLPTEAQWEFAARGGQTESRDGPIEETAWFDANAGDHTHQVAKKKPNGNGLFDMIGNVWEWVEDS